jgi:hypothetical protein
VLGILKLTLLPLQKNLMFTLLKPSLVISTGNPLSPHGWVQRMYTSQPVQTLSTDSTQSTFVIPTALHVKRKHTYLNTTEFCKLLKSALNFCAFYFCLFVLNFFILCHIYTLGFLWLSQRM